MKKIPTIKILLILAIFILISLACGSATSGEKIGESSSATSAPVKAQVYKTGDIIKVEEYTITLNSTKFQGSKLIANFTIDNSSGSKELAISSMLSFSAKDDEGNKLDYSICDGSGLDGKVLTGDKLKGNICWDGVKISKVKIYYEASFLSSGAIVWEVTK